MSEGSVRRHPRLGVGFAELRLPGVGAARSDPRFQIYWEAHHNPYLGAHGWQAAAATLHPDEVEEQNGDLVLSLGPAVCRHLEAHTYEIVLLGLAGRRFIVPWVEIPQQRVQGRQIISGRTTVEPAGPRTPTPEPPQRPPEPSPPELSPPEPSPSLPERPPELEPPSTDSSKKQLIGVVALLLIAIAGAVAYWMSGGIPQQAADAPPPVPSAAPTPSPEQAAACSIEGTVREIMGRPACAPEGYVDLARTLREAGRHEDALILLQIAVERGSAAAMALLGSMYDPQGFETGKPFAEPDPRQAAKLYRDAAQAGDRSIEQRRAALRDALQSKADAGDLMAKLTLGDFWP